MYYTCIAELIFRVNYIRSRSVETSLAIFSEFPMHLQNNIQLAAR